VKCCTGNPSENWNKGSGRPYVARNEIVHGEGTAFAFVIGEKDDANVLDCDNQGERPDDERESAEQIIMRWIRSKCTGVDIERTRARHSYFFLLPSPQENYLPNVAVDDSSCLVGQPHDCPSLEFLHLPLAVVIKITPMAPNTLTCLRLKSLSLVAMTSSS
jgi:hypothetical protein